MKIDKANSKLWETFVKAEKINYGTTICEITWHEKQPKEIKVLEKKPRYRGE